MRFGLLLLASLALSTTASAGFDPNNDRADFEVDFTEIQTSGEGCEEVFARDLYHAKYFLVGPTGRTLVNNFQTEDKEGFFHGLTFMSNFGYNNDYIFDKVVERSGHEYRVHIEGFVNLDVTYAEFAVLRGDGACEATATLSGFN